MQHTTHQTPGTEQPTPMMRLVMAEAHANGEPILFLQETPTSIMVTYDDGIMERWTDRGTVLTSELVLKFGAATIQACRQKWAEEDAKADMEIVIDDATVRTEAEDMDDGISVTEFLELAGCECPEGWDSI